MHSPVFVESLEKMFLTPVAIAPPKDVSGMRVGKMEPVRLRMLFPASLISAIGESPRSWQKAWKEM